MATKTFCDKCGVEMGADKHVFLTVQAKFVASDIHIDLCLDCFKWIDSHLKPKDKKSERPTQKYDPEDAMHRLGGPYD